MKKPLIISYSDQAFENRVEAGKLLGQQLKKLGYMADIVLGIPRGGIIIAQEIAHALGIDLDIVLSHKLGAPGNPEFAIGAITENGDVFLDETLMSGLGIKDDYIQEEINQQSMQIELRKNQIRNVRPKVALKGKRVIITDDGIATGSTMRAALWAVRKEEPKKLIAALPVGPQETLMRLAKDADEVICLRVPAFLAAIGQFYAQFTQTEDQEVMEILRRYYSGMLGEPGIQFIHHKGEKNANVNDIFHNPKGGA